MPCYKADFLETSLLHVSCYCIQLKSYIIYIVNFSIGTPSITHLIIVSRYICYNERAESSTILSVTVLDHLSALSCADPEKFVGGGPTHFFLVDAGRGSKDPNTTKTGSSSASRRNAI